MSLQMFVWQENNCSKDSFMAPKIRNRMEAMIKKDFLLKVGLQDERSNK